jgi:hypothetical protein
MAMEKVRRLSMWERVQYFPPAVCRILARPANARGRSQRPLTDEEIAQASGLPLTDVRSLSWVTSWDNVPVSKMRAFAHGCGIDLDDWSTIRQHLRFINRMRGKWFTASHYLRRDQHWENRWKPLIENYMNG